MNKKSGAVNLWLLLVCCVSITLAGCGRAHLNTVQEPSDLAGYEQIYIADVKVNSREQTEDAQALNAKWPQFTQEKLFAALQQQGKYAIATTPGAANALVLETDIDIVYGNRALRYFVGFGAGSGTCTVHMKLKDAASGEIKYEVNNVSDLSIGVFGGGMEDVIQKNINTAVEQFVAQL